MYLLLIGNTPKSNNKYRLRVKGWTTVVQTYEEKRTAGTLILILEQIVCNTKQVIKDSDGHFLLVKGIKKY